MAPLNTNMKNYKLINCLPHAVDFIRPDAYTRGPDGKLTLRADLKVSDVGVVSLHLPLGVQTPTLSADTEKYSDLLLNEVEIPIWDSTLPGDLPPIVRGVKYLVPYEILRSPVIRNDLLSLGPPVHDFRFDGTIIGYAGIRSL